MSDTAIKEDKRLSPALPSNVSGESQTPDFGWQQRNQVASNVYSNDIAMAGGATPKSGLSAVYLLFSGLRFELSCSIIGLTFGMESWRAEHLFI